MCHRPPWPYSGVLLVALGLARASSAQASCAVPESEIAWTYPDEATASVPPDAVFWAVASEGSVSVEIDGVPLSALGTEAIERHQFASPTPLGEGEHELVARVAASLADSDAIGAERRLRFRVLAQPPTAAEVSIDSVDIYPLVYDQSGMISPRDDEYDTACTDSATPLDGSCDDGIPPSLARVAYASRGDAIAYVVQGNTLVPPGCASFWTRASSQSDAASFRVAAVLPTGVTEAHEFSGRVEVRSIADSWPERFDKPASCSLGFSRSAPSGLGATAALALFGWFARRTRR